LANNFFHPTSFENSLLLLFRLEDKETLKELVEQHSDRCQKLDYLGYAFPLALHLILKLLRRGLHQRFFGLSVIMPSIHRWSLNESVPAAEEPITIGLILDQKFAFSVLDKGPSANLPEVIEYF
jgi:Nrap protein.